MSTSLDHDCDCSCHQENSFSMHMFPCCDGPCGICGRRIVRDGMDEHLREVHPESKENYASASGVEAVRKYDAGRAVLERPSPFKDKT